MRDVGAIRGLCSLSGSNSCSQPVAVLGERERGGGRNRGMERETRSQCQDWCMVQASETAVLDPGCCPASDFEHRGSKIGVFAFGRKSGVILARHSNLAHTLSRSLALFRSLSLSLAPSRSLSLSLAPLKSESGSSWNSHSDW